MATKPLTEDQTQLVRDKIAEMQDGPTKEAFKALFPEIYGDIKLAPVPWSDHQ